MNTIAHVYWDVLFGSHCFSWLDPPTLPSIAPWLAGMVTQCLLNITISNLTLTCFPCSLLFAAHHPPPSPSSFTANNFVPYFTSPAPLTLSLPPFSKPSRATVCHSSPPSSTPLSLQALFQDPSRLLESSRSLWNLTVTPLISRTTDRYLFLRSFLSGTCHL